MIAFLKLVLCFGLELLLQTRVQGHPRSSLNVHRYFCKESSSLFLLLLAHSSLASIFVSDVDCLT